jgi:predicted nicotinamide N-methyase
VLATDIDPRALAAIQLNAAANLTAVTGASARDACPPQIVTVVVSSQRFPVASYF